MKTSIKKVMVCILSAIMIIAALPVAAVGGSGNAVNANEVLFTAPVVVENPQYSYEISQPTLSVPTKEHYAPYFGNTVVSDAPVISEVTANAAPDDGIIIEGKGFTGAAVYTFGLASNGDGCYRRAEIASISDTTITAVIDENYTYGMYLVWVENSNGMSYPVRVNAPEADWISKDTADKGESVSIYGENLSHGNGTETAFVYIDGYGYTEVTEANPYKLTFTVPSDIADGNYSIYVHNGHGGKFGFSDKLSFTVGNNAVWNETRYTVAGFTQSDILSAVNSASDNDTVYFPNGTYVLNGNLTVSKALRFEGESKDGVIIRVQCAGSAFQMEEKFEFVNITFEDKTPLNVNSPVFIGGNDIDGALIRNCKFIKHKIYSLNYNEESYDPDNYADVGNGYGEGNIPYVELANSTVGGCVNLGKISNLIIDGCYFFAPRGVDVSKADGVKIVNNEFYGTWIMDSSNGPCAIKVNTGSRLDISDNEIQGADILVDPNGKLSTKDLTFDRSVAIQSPYGTVNGVYIAGNTMERVGSETGNAGEQMLFEEYGITYKGNPTAVNGNTVSFAQTDWFTDETDGKLKGYDVCGSDVTDNGSPREIIGQTAVIVNGNGASQYRKIISADASSVTVDKAWDIAPDENSFIMIVRQFDNITVYNNTVTGPDDYNKYSGHSAAVQAWANFFDFRVTENTVKNFAYGIECSPHYTYAYNRKAYNILEDVIISNNDVSNSTHGISVWFAFSNIDGVRSDYNFDGAPAFVQQNTVVRRNNIHNIVDTVAEDLVPAGQGITVGTFANEYKDWTDEQDIVHNTWDNASIHQGKWVKNTLVENNTFSNTANADILLQYHQGDTVLRDNTYSALNKVRYDATPNGAPAVYTAVDYTTPASDAENIVDVIVADNGYGSFTDGLVGRAETKAAQDKLYNGNFEEGLRYWGRDAGRNDSSKASDIASVGIEDNGNTYLRINKTAEETSAKSVRSVPFTITGLQNGDFVTFLYRYKYHTTANVNTKVALNVVSGDAKFYAGSPLTNLDSGVTKKIITSDFLDATGGWTWSISEIIPNSGSRYLTNVPESGEVTFNFSVYVHQNDVCELDIDDVTVIVKRFGENATPTGYWETLDGEWLKEGTYAHYYGTNQGVSGNATNLIPINTYNGDFEDDFKYWGDYKNGTSINENVKIITDAATGNKYLRVTKSDEYTDPLGVKSVPFVVTDLKAGDKVHIVCDIKGVPKRTDNDNDDRNLIYVTAASDQNIFHSGSGAISNLGQSMGSAINTDSFVTLRNSRDIEADTDRATLYLSAYINGNGYGTVNFDNIQILIERKTGDNITPAGFYHDVYGNLVKASDYTVYTEQDGIYGIGYNNANTTFLNGDFEQGFKYWGSDRSTDFATSYAKVKTESNGNKYIEINALNSYTPAITSYKFPIEGLKVNDQIGVLIKVKDRDNATVVRNNITVDLVPLDNAVTLNNRPNLAGSPLYNVGDGWYLWSTSQSNYKVTAVDSAKTPYFYVKLNGDRTYNGAILVDDVKVFKIVEGGDKLIGDSSHSVTALATTDGELINARSGLPLYGTKENGMYLADTQNRIDRSQYIALKGQVNPFDFAANGFMYWGSYFNGNTNTQAAALTFASDYATLKNGAVTLTDKGIAQGGIATPMLKVENNPNLVLIYENSGTLTDAAAAGNNRGEIGFVSRGNTAKLSLNNTNGSVVKNVLEIGNRITQSADGETYGYFYMFATTGFSATVKNLRYGYKDIGGMTGKYTEADGSPYGYSMGDANADGEVDILDLVRMKKYSADVSNTQIYFAAANFDKSPESTVSGFDLAAIKNLLLK